MAELASVELSRAVAVNDQEIMVSDASPILAGHDSEIRAILYIDREAMRVRGLVVHGAYTIIRVQRGVAGTAQTSHAAGAEVVVGPPQAFLPSDPSGACDASTVLYQPLVSLASGRRFRCVQGTWDAESPEIDAMAQGWVADVTPADFFASTTSNIWDTVVITGLPANSTRTFLWLCQVEIASPGTGGRSLIFGVPGMYAPNVAQTQPAMADTASGFQVTLLGRAATDGTGRVQMPITVEVVSGGNVTLSGLQSLGVRSRIQVFDMGTRAA